MIESTANSLPALSVLPALCVLSGAHPIGASILVGGIICKLRVEAGSLTLHRDAIRCVATHIKSILNDAR